MHRSEAFDLQRFVAAQETTYDAALAELTAGRKRTHWMWFIFPQLRGPGVSPTAQHYGIGSRDEARAYLAHAVLGPRLIRCTEAVLTNQGRAVHDIFGSPDDMKFRSSMTLFYRVGALPLFRQALDRFCEGREDERTLALLGSG